MGGKQSQYEHLRGKWIDRHRNLQTKLWNKHRDSLNWLSKNVAMGSLGGLLLLSAPNITLLSSHNLLSTNQQGSNTISKNAFVVSDLSHVLPSDVRPLTLEEEQKVGEILTRDFGIKVGAELSNKRLNSSYGYIGKEQHLARFPGDSIATHFDTMEEAREFAAEGMAPGLGAWGYFAPSKAEFTQKDNMREKYYIAVQTFLAPDFVQRVAEYRDFFQYRKMLVVNPDNGHAIVTVIGDAGPAEWTGKHLGGSPEVMHHLERVDGSLKGPVLYFFIDDPNDTILLGPVKL